MPPASTPARATLAAERDFAAAWWLLADVTGAERYDDPQLRWFHTGLADAYINPVLETRLGRDRADGLIDPLLDELSRRGAPFTWWVTPSSSPDDLSARLAARGLVADDPWPAMAVPVDEILAAPAVRGLEISRVTDEAGLEVYASIFAPILSTSPDFTALLVRASRLIGFDASAPELHLVGRLDGEPVATASLITAGGAAGIYNVATAEAARGRGIGTAMTAAAVAEGRGRGMPLATLQASTMGNSVYERLGFRHVGDFVPFHPARQG